MSRKAVFLLAAMVLALTVATHTIWVAVTQAQILDPLSSQQAYTTDDPNNPDRLGLATQTGRYSITAVDNCDWLATQQNILIWPEYRIPPWLAIGPVGADLPGCLVKVNGRMSSVQCFQDDLGVCDVNVELQ